MNNFLLTIVIAASIMFEGFTGFAQQVIRGPYLQNPTSASIVVRWRTDIATNSRVYYGTSVSSQTNYTDDLVLTTEHSVKLTGLAPFTKYYYSIGSTTQITEGNDSLYHFITSPLINTVQPIRVWAIGDFGKGSEGQRAVRDSYMNYASNTHTDIWLWLGDNAYGNGTDEQFQSNVFDSVYGYEKIMKNTPFMPVPGNHDYESVCSPTCNTNPTNHTGPYYDIVNVPANGEAGGVASGYELYYSYDYGNTHFVALNSELSSLFPFGYNWTGANPTSSFDCATSPMCQWLQNDLQANDKTFTVVYFHQPPYTDGSHDATQFWEVYMKAMRENFVPILEQYGVDLVICGHSHVYERSFLIKNHYDYADTFDPATMIVDSSSGNFALGEAYIKDPSAPIAQNGTVYVVAGNSGSKDDNAALNYPAMYYGEGCSTCYGSLVLDINGNRLDGKYLRSDGSIGDDFTIIKSVPISVNEINNPISKLKIFPNPFKSQTNVEYSLKSKSKITIELMDMKGTNVLTIVDEEQGVGEHKFIFDAEKLSLHKGIYTIRIKAGGKNNYEKIIKVE